MPDLKKKSCYLDLSSHGGCRTEASVVTSPLVAQRKMEVGFSMGNISTFKCWPLVQILVSILNRAHLKSPPTSSPWQGA